jgi:hypothetical protein
VTFTQVQNGSAITGSTSGGVGTLQLTLPVASTAGTLLVACMVASESGVPFKITAVGPGGNPNTSPGWEWCCTSVNGAGTGGQQVEIWCYRKNPGGVTNTTWTVQSGQGTRGHLMEFSTTQAYQVMELFPGLNTAVTAGATSFPVAMGNPVGAGELAVAMFGDNFTTGTLVTWTTPSGWTTGRTTGGSTIANHWASYYQTTAAAGAVSVTGVTSTATNQIGWEAAVVVFREAASVAARVGGSCSAGTYNDQSSFGLPSSKAGSAAEADIFVGRTMFQAAQVSYQHEGDHLTTGPSSDMLALSGMGAQIVWAMRPRRTGVTGFTSVADEQAAVDQDLTWVKQSGINGFICTSFNEHNYGGVHGPFGDDTTKNGGDPYGNVTDPKVAQRNWLTYWANYQPTYAAHGIPIYTKPSYASPASCSSWHPPAGTVSGVVADFYYSDSAGKTAYLDQSPGTDPGTGLTAPALTAVCDGTKNADNTSASNTPIPLGIGEWGRAGGTSTPAWSLVVAWSHTGGGTGHLRDLFAARLAAGKQNAPVLWFENNGPPSPGPNWIHTPGFNGEDQTGIQAELAAIVDALSPQAAGTTVVVTTTSLPNAPLGVPYSQALQVTGGAAPYTWATLTGSLPTGLTLSAAGVISGTPTVAGTYTFTVKATDSGSNIGNSGSLSILVPALSVTTTTLPAASVGVAYTQTLTESGGTGPFTWAVTADSVLPAGITLSTAGVLSGTTGDSPGQYAFTVVVTDSLSATASAALTLTVSAGSTGGGGNPAVLPPGFPQVIVEAGFYSSAPVAQPGALILDDPTFGDLDSAFLGDSTAWTDITTFVRSGTINRASTRVQGPLRTYQAGTASVTLKNADGRFDPDNLSGPYVAGSTSSIRPMVPVRIRAIWQNVEYHLFQGFIDTWSTPDTNYGPNYAETTASATDGFKILAGVTIPARAASGAGEQSGARVDRILTEAKWYTDHRVIAQGDSELQGTPMGDTALNLLQLTADSEIGELYIDGSGNVVFRQRRDILEDPRSATSQAVFGDQGGTQLPYQAVGRANDDTTLANDVQITAANGGTLQEAQNPASIATYLFPRSYARDDVLLTSDAEALSYAQWVLRVSLAGEDRFDTLTVTPLRDLRLWPHVLGRDIGDRITIVRDPPGMPAITKDVFIRGISHTVDYSAGTWQTVWDLQDASKYAGFLILGDATLGRVSKGNKLAY